MRCDIEDDDEDKTESKIKVEHNHIYFYLDVTRSNIQELIVHISKLESQLLIMKSNYNLQEIPCIYLHLQSDGGDAYAGLACMDALQSCRVPVTTIVDGFVASAATFILMGGTYRIMRKHSSILIHQIRTWFTGKYNDLCDEVKNCDNLMKLLRKVYQEHSNLPVKTIDSILAKEICLLPDQCLRYKLINEIQ